MVCYVCHDGHVVKGENGINSYKGGEMITIIVNLHMSYVGLVSLVWGKLSVEPNWMKFYYTYKFEPSLLGIVTRWGKCS